MSYDLNSAEKVYAEKALICFNIARRKLNIAKNHLDIMGTPFKDHPDIPEDQIISHRAAMRLFRDKSLANFDQFKEAAFKCIAFLQPFSNDTQTTKFIKSFTSLVEALETNVNDFAETFENLKDKNFVASVSKSIKDIQDKIDQIDELIEDRIKPHLQSDILGKSWVLNVGDKLNVKLDQKEPIMVDLSKEEDKKTTNN